MTQSPDAPAALSRDGKDVPGFCTFCRSRCGSLNRIENGRLVSVRPLPDHPTGKALCPKGRAAPELVHSARRLTRPLRRTKPKGDPDPGFEEIGWDEALDIVASNLARFAEESGPESVAFSFSSPSATSISDALPWLERFVWNFGSPNISWATELCNWHKDHAHKLTMGTGLAVPDYANSDLIVLWGHNPEKVWLAQAEVIAKALRNGAKLAIVDPRKTGMAAQADHWMRVRPGTDGALALALIWLMMEERSFDEPFVRQWSNAPFLVREDTGKFLRGADIGLAPAEAFVAWSMRTGDAVAIDTAQAPDVVLCGELALDGSFEVATEQGERLACRTAFSQLRAASAPYTPERVADICWVEAEHIRHFARLIADAERVSYYGWTGVGQHANATQTDRAIACLFAMKGQYDGPGGNVVWPEIPIAPISDYSMLAPQQAKKALGLAERPLGPSSGGWVTGAELYRAILDADPYPIRALVSFGSNVLASQPDPQIGRAALRKLEFQVHCDLFMNPSAMAADIILPVNSAWERDGLRAGFEISLKAQQLLQLRPAMVTPIGESRSDFDIVAALAQRLGFGDLFANGDWDAAHNRILEPLGITTEMLRHSPGGLSVPLTHDFRSYAQTTDTGVRGFATPSHRIELYSSVLQQHGYAPVPDFVAPEAPTGKQPLVLTTAKNGYFCHTQHRGLSGLRRKSPHPTVDIHPETAAARGIAEFSSVEIVRGKHRVTMHARFDDSLHPDVVVAEYGWWQSAPDVGAPSYEIGGGSDASYNSLVSSEHVDPVSGAPTLRSLCCEIRPAPLGEGPRWSGYRKFRVAAKSAEAPGVTTLTLEPSDGVRLAGFKAGQFLSLKPLNGNKTDTARSYSLVSKPDVAPRSYRVAIRRLEHGALSGVLSDISVGDEVEAACPDGHFTLPFENEFPVVLIASGIGITPFMSLLEQLAGKGGQETWLYYGSRNSAHHAFRQRIAEIERETPGLTVRNFYSRPLAHEPGPYTTGRVSVDHIDPGLLRRRARFYMCGPDDMLSAFRIELVARGVPDFEIFHERFTVPRRQIRDDLKPCNVVLKRKNRTLNWSPVDGSILDLAEKNGLELPAGCRTGQCESCAVTVLSGKFAHFVDVADDEPDRCLACQAYPLTDVILDL